MKDSGVKSRYYTWIEGVELDNNRKGRIAENAVAFRLSLLGFEFYRANDGNKADFIVIVNSVPKKIQVKWACLSSKDERPYADLRCASGRKNLKKYSRVDFDYLFIYSLYTDSVYLYSADEVIGKAQISVKETALERWEILGS